MHSPPPGPHAGAKAARVLVFLDYATIFAARGLAYHEAMERWPGARDSELRAAVEPLRIEPGERLIDMPSGGAYLARLLPPTASYLAVETASAFHAVASAKPGVSSVLVEALDRTGLPDGAGDAIVCLSGLHHIADRGPVYAEMARLLRPGGRLCIAEVGLGTPVDRFLNGFVDAHSTQGHEGDFFSPRDVEALAARGLEIRSDQQVDYTWEFPDEESMATFCKLLFGIDRASPAEVLRGIGETVGYSLSTGRCSMGWGLRVVLAQRPRPRPGSPA